MTKTQSGNPRPGDMVLLIGLPPDFLDDLPSDDQEAITAAVGKPIRLTGYGEGGMAELEFEPKDLNFRTIYVAPKFIKAIE